MSKMQTIKKDTGTSWMTNIALRASRLVRCKHLKFLRGAVAGASLAGFSAKAHLSDSVPSLVNGD